MEWIKVDDKRPEEGQEVVYYFKITGRSIGKYYRQELTEMGYSGTFMDCFGGDDGYLCEDVTHWMPYTKDMPLPEPPKEEVK